jgi:uncharacterized membrane protein YfcA
MELLPPELGAAAVAVLAIAAVGTSILSAVVGMAGGMTLLSVMLLFLDPLVAIPLHGAVQLVSNASRAWIQRSYVQPHIAICYALPLIPAGFLGLEVASRLPPAGTRIAIGAFVLLATWRPRWLLLGAAPRAASDHTSSPRQLGVRFGLVGALNGALGVTIGATGPLLAPFFLGLSLSRLEIVATQAICQMSGHAAKLAIFGSTGFQFVPWLGMLVLLSSMVSFGTWLGSQLLHRIDERRFTLLYKSVLTALSLELLFGGVKRLLSS